MAKRLAVLHTSFVFINVETMINDLLKELLPGVEISHFIDSTLLAAVTGAGHVTDAATRRMCCLALGAAASGVDMILSACSSLGPGVDVARHLIDTPIVKIDDAMAERAVAMAERIGVLATVPTTLGPTVALIREKAALAGRPVAMAPQLAEGAFDVLMSGNKQEHDDMVLRAAETIAPQSDVLVLAQASMTRLAPAVQQRTNLPVLTSPRLGIEQVKRLLAQQPGA